jgi:hypothetical protein
MASSISSGWPGVRVKIVDNSQYVEALSSNLIGFICINSEKGPDNTPRLTTSASDFIRTYGSPDSSRFGQGGYVALQYLKTLSNLYVMRVLPDDATYAFKALKLSANPTTVVTRYEVDEAGNKTEIKEVDTTKGVLVSQEDLASKSLDEIISENEGSSLIIPEAVSINYTIDPTVKLYGARSESEKSTGSDRAGGETVVTSMNPSSSSVEMVGFKFTGKSFAGNFVNTEVIQVSNSVFEDLSQAYSSTANFDVIEYDSTDPETSIDDSEAKAITIVETTETTNNYSFVDSELSEFHSVAEMDYPLSNGTVDMVLYPYGRGEYYNNIGYKITKARKSYDGAFVLDIYTKSKDSAYPSLVESFIVSFDRNATDSSGASLFIEDVLDRYSEYLRCKVNDNIMISEDTEEEDADGNITVVSNSYDELAMADIEYLSGGSDGAIYTKSGALDWNKMTGPMIKAYTGVLTNPEVDVSSEEALSNGFITDTEDFDISVVFDAGYPTAVKDAIIELCNKRDTCFGILDNGIYTESGNKNAKDAITKRLTDHNWSNYRAALYEPYTKIYDAYTGKNIWMTPIYHVTDLMVRTARDYDIFWAFAGLRRGAVSTSIQQYRYLLQGGYRDQFKDDELNPIVRFTNGGDVLWGNWTTQQTPSALKNVHVVLCLQYIQRTLERNLKQYVYEFNDEYTYALIKNSVNNFLSELQSQRALESFSVSVTATEYQKRNNQCQVDINLKVTGVIEIINVSLNVQ